MRARRSTASTLPRCARAGWRCEDGHLHHPHERKLLFLGDLVDRGPDSVGVVRLVRQAVLDGVARVVKGNHELKLVRFLQAARTEGIERWSSLANAETGMQFLKLSDGADPIAFRHMERVRVTLINDTMMPHPIHIHGHFFQLITGEDAAHNPRKHTVNVLPGGKVSFDLTADALGDWAFHCHMLMHMHAGMMRVVTVRHGEGGA